MNISNIVIHEIEKEGSQIGCTALSLSNNYVRIDGKAKQLMSKLDKIYG